jgi:hypothetical protein
LSVEQRHRQFAALRNAANQLEANIARFSPENYNFEKEVPRLLCRIQFSIPNLMEEGAGGASLTSFMTKMVAFSQAGFPDFSNRRLLDHFAKIRVTSRTLSLGSNLSATHGEFIVKDKPNPSWNLDYARSLTLDQWTDELNNHFLQKIGKLERFRSANPCVQSSQRSMTPSNGPPVSPGPTAKLA